MELWDKKMDEDLFRHTRSEVLNQWPTGRGVSLEDALAYHKAAPPGRCFDDKLTRAKEQKRTLIQPRGGTALVEGQIELLSSLQNKGQADLLSASCDPYTRQNRFKEAQAGVEQARLSGDAPLNGFPVVNHGVEGCRRVAESVERPVQLRYCAPDSRLLSEIALAGGFTSMEGGGISSNIPYAKGISLEKSIADWQYVDRLAGLYQEAGVCINREPFGPLTGTLIPPCIALAVGVLESLLAAQQGVRSITVGYAQCGNLLQDVAAIQTLEQLTVSYLAARGYRKVNVSTVLHQWMGGFPQDEAKAYSVIALGSAAAALAHATKVIVKTPREALGSPGPEANIQGLLCTRQMTSMLSDQWLPENSLQQEKKIIAAETRCIVDRCIELGDGDVVVGVVRGFQAGIIDVPFAPSRFNAGKMLPARDNSGAVRILEPGAVPLSAELLDFNRQKIEERAASENRKISFQMVIDDVYAISKGKLVGRPK